ncbi:Fe-S cluster assembly protein NifU [Pseudomonas stutzeri]|jgi:NifU-like protein|uniref:Nitrogen fixation protein NifU n=1 Tax=Stutzerimonas stutzeri TaxID=316 RepID=A0A4V3RDG0_STUST|nr:MULTISPECIES: Fe-S cluster assembly protein NifU [Stutzerimonas]EPL62069.1 Fe-S cluster assembly protein NifU [Stutzerimonas stutzeri B1SMN1]MBA4690046.1 Fe-S cluster assembly protein NifU [Pseudomonas sp.]NMY64721.1 Fe-S cluster assembly protein NifU [Pseudomonas sp. WS 5018]OHC16950.1 MAG: Fe-S cluster assembly protein NifU [Pseudomonadales bacterium RIFCSPHIGHO2_01_FULL_64_12]AEA83291.1 Fe-S cluster assembly protein NifU [Stutzerimonas stutzeri DSM 4166]
MWDYSEKVKEHFYNPKNAGAVAEANAVGDVGSLSCGDALRLSLKVDPDTDVILDAGFQTFGCGSAIASSSALTEMVKGLTVDEALKISNQDIADFLDGLPPEKMHCSVMGREALQAAVANYRGETLEDDHEEGALVCKCFAIDEVMVRETIRANRLSSVEDVTNYTKAGGGCSSCHEGIERLLVEELAARGEIFVPAGTGAKAAKKAKAPLVTLETPPVAPQAAPTAPRLTTLQRIRRVERVLESIRPTLQRDHGDVELLDVEGKNIYVKLTGACTGCQMASMTLSGIQQRLIEELGEFVKVVPVSSPAHSAMAEV